MMAWAVLAFALFVLALGVMLFNGLVSARNQVRAAWSDIDVQLKRRYDLVPQLVTVVQAYADYERATLITVAELRARAMAAQHLADKAQLEGELARQIDRILVLQERYPDLKASENFLALQRDLVDVENYLQYARRYYNGSVRDLNNRIESFPSLLVARVSGFRATEFYRADGAQDAQT